MEMEADEQKKVKFNQQNLYKEEVFTDLTVGSIRQLTPVKSNGETDKARKMLYSGHTQVMTPHGPIPIQFPIDSKNLHEAMEKFPAAMEQYVEKLVAEAKEIERQSQSQIIVPGQKPDGNKIIY